VQTDDGVLLHGAVTGVADAAAAGVILVLAQSPDGAGLYAADTASSGVVVTACQNVDPTRKLFDVDLVNAPARLVGAASDEAVAELIDDITIAYAADAVGAADAVMKLAIEYAKVRKQFGQPIGSFQAVQHLCVDMYETVELARSGVIHALWAADAADPTERHLAAVRAKAFAGHLASVGDTAIQVFGGIGFTWEHDAHLYLKRLLGWSAFLGAPDRYLTEVGTALVGQHNRKVLQ
jgi:alkylation response protein AidB-like acyl-CoA dehydrogenase